MDILFRGNELSKLPLSHQYLLSYRHLNISLCRVIVLPRNVKDISPTEAKLIF